MARLQTGKTARLLTAFLGSALAFAIVPASATHSWGPAHWSRTSTLNIRVGDAVSSAWDAHLVAAAADWSAPANVDMSVVATTTNPATCAPIYGRVEACSAAYGSTGWLGIANIWTSGGHIVQGTVKLNDTYFADPYFNTPAWRRFVMCQELGHVLGLDHQDVNQTNVNLGSCMDYTNDPSGTRGTNGTLNNLKPNVHDRDQLNLIYTHIDQSQLTSTRLSSSAARSQADERGQGRRALGQVGNRPGEWGRAIAQDARGKSRLFVRDLGDGELVYTFVIWADQAHSDAH